MRDHENPSATSSGTMTMIPNNSAGGVTPCYFQTIGQDECEVVSKRSPRRGRTRGINKVDGENCAYPPLPDVTQAFAESSVTRGTIPSKPKKGHQGT